MRPRIQKGFGTITFKDLDKLLNDNNCFGFTVRRISSTILEYKYLMMFRNLKSGPTEILITVSRTSKLVIGLSIADKKYNNIDSFIKVVKIKK